MCFGGGPNLPAPTPPPPPPQAAKAPETTPLKKRNTDTGGIALPTGSTLLTGASGITTAQLNLGTSSLLGGGKE